MKKKKGEICQDQREGGHSPSQRVNERISSGQNILQGGVIVKCADLKPSESVIAIISQRNHRPFFSSHHIFLASRRSCDLLFWFRSVVSSSIVSINLFSSKISSVWSHSSQRSAEEKGVRERRITHPTDRPLQNRTNWINLTGD